MNYGSPPHHLATSPPHHATTSLPHYPTTSPPHHPRLAVVSPRYGTNFVGGAESSLRTIAATLHEAGCAVEVFTTCASESDWANHSSEGTSQVNGIAVHRFRVDAYEKTRQREAVRAIVQAGGCLPEDTERQYLDNSLRSTRLPEALRKQIDQWDAVLAGPYLYALTFDIARAFPDKTVLLPCFHNEPFARLRIWREAYQQVGGILYHSQEEKDLAEIELGINHPGAVCVGTYLDTATQGDAERGQTLAGSGGPYIVYCGRYLREKNLPTLLDYARHYQERHPGRFTFVFMGEGEVVIPRVSWARDLGFVDEVRKRDILAGAAALAQLSHYESLSLVALEAWAQGVPVLAASLCPVLAGHLHRCGGGRAVEGYESFAAALDDLWRHPQHWQALGQRGREYVRACYGSRENFLQCLFESIGGLTTPLAERMRRQGLLRAARYERSAWRERFGRIVEELLESPPRQKRDQVEVQPRTPTRAVSAELDSVLVPVRLTNRGTLAAVAEGPGRVLLRSLVVDESGQACGLPAVDTPLPGLLVPEQEAAAVMRVPVPAAPGAYHVALFALSQPEDDQANSAISSPPGLRLIVEPAQVPTDDHCCAPSLQAMQKALAEAERKQRLPEDYTDVTEGLLATWKRWIKGKLLGNFKHAYVDVLSRQQSAFNRQILLVLHELAECSATLDHALATLEKRLNRLEESVSVEAWERESVRE